MKTFLKVAFWTFLPTLFLGFGLYGVFSPHLDDIDRWLVYFLLLFLWWELSILIVSIIVKWKKYRKDNPPMSKEQKQWLKQIEKKRKYRNSKEFKQKYISEAEIENAYFGNGVLVKDSSPEYNCYTDIKSGFDRLFDSFGKKSDRPCDLSEFIVKEDNIEYVLASLEKIYKNSGQIMEECYDEIYKEIVEFFENICEESLKKEFDLDYLKENWRIYSIAIEDDAVQFDIGIDAAEDPDADSYYDIIISVGYDTLKPSVSFNVVW